MAELVAELSAGADDASRDGRCTAWPLAKNRVRDAEDLGFFPDVARGHSLHLWFGASGMSGAR